MRFIFYSQEILSKEYNDFILQTLDGLKPAYPNIKRWFFDKVIRNIGRDREIVVLEFKKDIAGILILKYSENKISTIFVNPKYRRMGFGKLLIKKAQKLLNTPKPKISISDLYLHYFNFILRDRNFYLSFSKHNDYASKVREYFFNF